MKFNAKTNRKPAVRSRRIVSPSVKSKWEYTPTAEEQLERMVDALNDITELAEQIKDPECFRQHAKKIAKANACITSTASIQIGG